MSNYLRQPGNQAPIFPTAPAPVTEAAVVFTPPLDVPSSQILGDAGSSESLRQLLEHTNKIKQIDTLVLLKEALMLFKRGSWAAGGEAALKALHVDEKSGDAWHILAVAREKCGDVTTALTCYETALRLMPENPGIANDLGRLSYRLNMVDLAEKFFRFFLSHRPGNAEAINNLASVLREKNDLDGAIALLQEAISANPQDASLWNAIGTVVNARGETANAALFYAEALKHGPDHMHALYNYGNALAVMGQIEEGLVYLKRALTLFTDPMNIYTCKISLAFCYLALGDLDNGWAWYADRGKENTAEQITYVTDRPRWKAGMAVQGRRIFVSAEQGLGDEIMFATLLPDLIREVGPDGHVGIAVEKRLVPLFEKAFPQCTVTRHHTTKYKSKPVRLFPDIKTWDEWDDFALMADFFSRYRGRIEDFPTENAFLKPDPERVAYWKALLAGVNDKPKVGVLWKSAINHSRRNRYYSPFEQWQTVMAEPGIQFVNLQYGNTDAEMEEARANGLDIWTPPGIDLKNDLDDLSALCVALDGVMGHANATCNIAGAAGATVWLVTHEKSWTCLGTDRYPWYPTAHVVFSSSMEDWEPVMLKLKGELTRYYIA